LSDLVRAFSALFVVAAMAPQAHGQTRRFRVDVAQQPLGQALIAFAIQTNISISTPVRGLGAIKSNAVRGDVTPEAGLRRIVEGSGFVIRTIDPVTFIVTRGRTPQAPPQQMQSPSTNDVVVITAAPFPTTIDRFAASASVLDADAIQRMTLRSTSDLAEAVAGLTFTNLGPGRNKIILRGLSDGAFTGRTESTIGIYVGDSRISYGAPDPDIKLVDIEQVEVLRGPQGALYGSGSIGGIYRINPALPDLFTVSGMLSTSAETTEGGGLGGDVAGVLNVPIVEDRLGVRLVGWGETTAGWLDNASLGLRNSNRTLRRGYRATALAKLGDTWSVAFSTLQQSIDSKDSQYIGARLGERQRLAQIREPHDNDFGLVGLAVRGATPLGEFSSTTSFLHHQYDSRFDATGAFAAFGVDPSRLAAFDDGNHLDFVTEEARLTGLASPIPWAVGASASIGQLATHTQLAVEPNSNTPQVVYNGVRLDHIREYAVFGDVVLPVTAHVNFAIGLRGFLNQLRSNSVAKSTAPALADSFTGKRRQDIGVAPQIRLSYEPDDGGLYYVQASNGYRSGGFNSGAGATLTADSTAGSPQPFRSYAADELWNYEIGIKRTFFGGRLKVRTAGFWQFWENIQTDQLVASGLPFTGNIGNGQIRGAELETMLRWSDNLRVSSHLTFANVEINDTNASFPVSPDAGLPGTPALTGGGSIDYKRPLGTLGDLQVHLGATYVGRSPATFVDQTGATTGGYVEANLRASLERDGWRATLFLDNMTNAEGATFSFGNTFRFGADELVTPLRPRTFGLQLSRRF